MGWQHKHGQVADVIHNPFLAGLKKLLIVVAVIAGLVAYANYEKRDGGATFISGAIAVVALGWAGKIKHTKRNTREYQDV